MNEIIIPKELIIPNLTPGEIMLLKLIYDKNKQLFKRYFTTYKDYIPALIESLENKLYLKNTGDEFDDLVLRQKTLDLLETTKVGIQFEQFWNKYYSIVIEWNKIAKNAAEKKWNRLTNKHKQLAYDNIQAWYDSLNVINGSKASCYARTYLENKYFLEIVDIINHGGSTDTRFSLT